MRQRYKQRGAPKDRCRGQGMGSVFRFAPKKKKKTWWLEISQNGLTKTPWYLWKRGKKNKK